MLFKKLTFKYDKPLVVKSPTHTGHVRLLLEMFPEAKFVHIHRNPFEVFSSTLKMLATASPWFRLHS
ncbi:MAG: sulfotransferase [Planctomycetes bacterium]|nr:sulfotransferase [Planctomycetota bacterium]